MIFVGERLVQICLSSLACNIEWCILLTIRHQRKQSQFAFGCWQCICVTNVRHSCNSSLSLFELQKKHASVNMLTGCSWSICYRAWFIWFTFKALTWLWLYFDEQFLWYIAFFSVSFWERSLYATKVLIRFSNERGKPLISWSRRDFSKYTMNKMNFRAVLHQNLQQKMQMIMFLKVPFS